MFKKGLSERLGNFVSGLIVFSLFWQCDNVLAGDRDVLGLSLSFKEKKKEYSKLDPIYISLKLTNESNKGIYINKRFFVNSEDSSQGEIYLSVISPPGEKLPCVIPSRNIGLPKTDYFMNLEPGQEVSSEREVDIKNYFDFSTPGEYKISAIYQNVYGEEIGINAYTNKVKSDIVIIEIVE